jgi:DNA primase catalytic core
MGVKASRGYYHCFTCQAAGNLIQFVMNYRELEYFAAIEEIAHIMGIEVVYVQVSPAEQERFNILETLVDVQNTYRKAFLNPTSFAFLHGRGITSVATQEEYGLGYGVDLDDSLQQEYIKAGVYKLTESQAYFHIFKRRITFPIRSPSGDILGFAGRSIGDIPPKYINSTETLLFKKNKCVYGLYEALQRARRKAAERAIKKLSQVLLVEGYFDVISLGQVSINAVASMGTAMSVSQLETIYRYTDKIIVCMDGDDSGARACQNILSCFAQLQVNKVLLYCSLPEGEDPDSFIVKYGVEAFKDFVVQNCLNIHDYFIKLTSDTNLLLTLHKAEVMLSKLPTGYCKISLAHHFVKHHSIPTDMLHKGSALRIGSNNRAVISSIPSPLRSQEASVDILQSNEDNSTVITIGMLSKEQWIVALMLQYPELCKPIILQYELRKFPSPLKSFLEDWLLTETNDIASLKAYSPGLEYDILGLYRCDLSLCSQPQACIKYLLDNLGPSKQHAWPPLSKIFPSVRDKAQRVLITAAYKDKKLYCIPLLLAHDQHDQNK